MEDAAIIELYWQRCERAIEEPREKYGGYCYSISYNLLRSQEDAEECVSDAWHAAWNAMPPQRPQSLRAWLGKVTRNLSLKRWQHDHRQKRDGGMTALLSELGDCLPSPETVEKQLEAKELSAVLDRWLAGLGKLDRQLFVRRYWYGVPLQELARERKTTPAKLAQKMLRLRQSLRKTLEKEGIGL